MFIDRIIACRKGFQIFLYESLCNRHRLVHYYLENGEFPVAPICSGGDIDCIKAQVECMSAMLDWIGMSITTSGQTRHYAKNHGTPYRPIPIGHVDSSGVCEACGDKDRGYFGSLLRKQQSAILENMHQYQIVGDSPTTQEDITYMAAQRRKFSGVDVFKAI